MIIVYKYRMLKSSFDNLYIVFQNENLMWNFDFVLIKPPKPLVFICIRRLHEKDS